MTSLKQSKTTHNLISQLARIKGEKQNIVDRLNDEITKNKQILDEPVRVYRSQSQKTVLNRERSIELFQKRLDHKKEADRVSDAKLQAFTLKHEKKREELERRLQEIAKRNANRLQQLKDLEENVLKKINHDIQKNQNREKHLKEDYERIRKEENKLKQVKQVQKKVSIDQWKVLQNEKFRLELLARQNQERQNKLIEERSPVLVKKPEKKQAGQKYIPNEKQYHRLKGSSIKDSKEIGRQYLEQVKLIHREALVKNKKKNLMNLNLKVIGYNRDIMDRIFRNTSDLSKLEKLNAVIIQKNEEKEITDGVKLEKEPEMVPQPRSQFLLAEDLQTQRYLRQIKVNLQELENINQIKNKQKLQFESERNSNQMMILPSTLEQS